jgi:hypothetical protein
MLPDRIRGPVEEAQGRADARSRNKFCRLLPKIEPLRGSLHAGWKRRRKPAYRRMDGGERHGPHWSPLD